MEEGPLKMQFALRLPSLILALCGTVSFGAPALADPVADFYKGRNINIIVGYSVGGGYDLYARTLARHMGRHIPGNPTMVVQNMAGAGSLKAANYIYGVAPKDGTVLGTFARGLAMEPLIGTSATQFEATKFTWLGSGTDELSVCVTWYQSHVKSWDDALATPFTVAGEGSGSDPDIFSSLLKNTFGLKLKLVSGYPGAAEMSLAIERGEVDGRCGWSWSSVKSLKPEWITDKKLNVLVQLTEHKSGELPEVPTIMEKTTSERQQQMLRLVISRQVMGRPFAAPPGLPPDRAKALQTAFTETLRDPAFLGEAKTLKLEVNPVSGADVEKLIGDLYRTPPDVIAETKAAIAKGAQ
jgi:tripartite-type tricarboxylate transporter receptor subunit TctC